MPTISDLDGVPVRPGSELDPLLQVLRRAAVITDREGAVAQMNSAAQSIVRRCDGLCLRDGLIEVSHRSAKIALRHAIHEAIRSTAVGGRRAGSLRCPRPSGRRSYVVHVTPLDAHIRTGPALVVIVDPEPEPWLPKAQLRNLFGLTNAEADVALLVMRGTGLKPISAAMSLSLTTVKTHLQHVFDKTDTHRQAELVRLLFAIAP